MSSFRKKITVRRIGEGSYNNAGFFVKNSADSQFDIYASVQPATGSEMKLLPENRREEESYKIFTDTKLFSAEKGSVKNADIVILQGIPFEVVKVLPWQNSVIPHYKIFISKRTTNDAEPQEIEAW